MCLWNICKIFVICFCVRWAGNSAQGLELWSMTSVQNQMENANEHEVPSPQDSQCLKNDIDPVSKELSDATNVYLLSCIKSWKQIFPWMHYVDETQIFICTLCEWGSLNPNLIEIMRLKTSREVHSVAKKLRKHNENEDHKRISSKRDLLFNLCSYVYPLVKGFSQDSSSLEDVINNVTDVAGGSFPGPQQLPAKYAFIGYMIKRIAECIEENFLNSLAESPFFSVLSHESNEFAIIRWLNNKGESEEHLFCSRITYLGHVESCLSYLAINNIDMNKLVSFSKFLKSSESDKASTTAVVPEVPIRSPPFELFLNWIEEASFLKDLFQQLNVITKLCKTYYHKFAGFPEAADLMSMEEPFSYSCIMNKRILEFFFANLKSLRRIAGEIHKKTRNMEAYGFSAVELQDVEATERCAAMLPELSLLVSSVFTESQASLMALEKFKNKVSSRMIEINDSDVGEYVFLTLFDIFLSHVLVTLHSPGKKITEVLSKKVCNVSISDIEVLLSNLMKDYKGSNQDCLNMFHLLQSSTSLDDGYTLLELLEALHKRPDLQEKFTEFCVLHKKIKVLPCYPADVQQSMFSVSTLQFFLAKQVPAHLNHPMTLIILEGPTAHLLNVEQVLDMWARKWKCGIDNKFDVSNIQEIVYPV